jgi:hypothetical protein
MSDAPDHATTNDSSDAQVAPGDVASAARSCQVIILILLALAAIVCVVAAIAVFR